MPYRINETRKRSLLKTVTSRLLEILADTLIFECIFRFLNIFDSFSLAYSFGIAILVEGTCFCSGYLNERIWNKINWGREVKNRKV